MKLAIYDFDGTLYEKETLPFIIKYYGKKNYSKIKLIQFYIRIIGLTLKYKLKLDESLDKEKYRATSSKIFMHLFENMKKEQINKFFCDCVIEMIKHFNPEVVKSINNKKKHGYHIVVCSGANTLLLNGVANYIEYDTVIGTELHFLENGLYDFDAQLVVITGKNKSKAVLERFKDKEVDWENSYAYGDSYYDFDVMNLTGNPVAVNPDEGLRKVAVENGWEILGEQ